MWGYKVCKGTTSNKRSFKEETDVSPDGLQLKTSQLATTGTFREMLIYE